MILNSLGPPPVHAVARPARLRRCPILRRLSEFVASVSELRSECWRALPNVAETIRQGGTSRALEVAGANITLHERSDHWCATANQMLVKSAAERGYDPLWLWWWHRLHDPLKSGRDVRVTISPLLVEEKFADGSNLNWFALHSYFCTISRFIDNATTSACG